MIRPLTTDLLVRNWGPILLRGIGAILLGIFTLWMPGITFQLLVLFFGVYALVSGALAIIAAVRRHGTAEDPRWPYVVLGLLTVGAGLATLFWPAITALAMLWIVAIWAFTAGIAEIAAAIRLRKVITGEWKMVLAGVLSVLLAVALIASPIVGALALVSWIGIYAILYGALEVSLGLHLRSWGHHPTLPEHDYMEPAESRP